MIGNGVAAHAISPIPLGGRRMTADVGALASGHWWRAITEAIDAARRTSKKS
jgi:hypothetical protein